MMRVFVRIGARHGLAPYSLQALQQRQHCHFSSRAVAILHVSTHGQQQTQQPASIIYEHAYITY